MTRSSEEFREHAFGQLVAVAAGEGKCAAQRIAKFRIELTLQPPPGAQQTRRHGLLRNLQNVRGLLDTQAFDLAQHKDRAERLGQVGNGTLKQLGDLPLGFG
jgi:hypothetical protein